jgi:predicted kinase
MPRLILLNGPPALGKSTLARLYVQEHPLALNLDIDRVRDLIGRWRDQAFEAGLLARSIALAGARAHLSAGYDVVVPQLLARPAFIEQAAALADEVDCAFHEIVLLDTKENALLRFTKRTTAGREPAHRDVAEMLDRQGGLLELEAMYDRLMALVSTRPATKIVRTRDGDVEQAYRDFLHALA